MALCKVRTIQITGMFEKAIVVHPEGGKFWMDDRIVQEAFVGYKYGTYFKLGLVCEHTPASAYTQSANSDTQLNAEEEKKEEEMQVDEQNSGPKDRLA